MLLQPDYHLHGHIQGSEEYILKSHPMLRPQLDYALKPIRPLALLSAASETSCNTYVRPVLEFTTTVRDLHTQFYINVLEAVQR